MDEKLRRLFWEMGLENTRLLVKGIGGLHLGYRRELSKTRSDSEDSWQLDKLQKFVFQEYRDSLSNGHYLAQNPYVELWKFRRPAPDITWMECTDSLRLSGMILLYHQLQILEDCPDDQLAEAYETLCNSIRSILDADMCYLVSRHLTDTRMLCASSVKKEDLDTQLGSKEAGELLDKLKEKGSYIQPTEGIFLKAKCEISADKEKNWEDADVLILPIMLYDKKGDPLDKQVFLICQRWKTQIWRDELHQTLLQVRDTLFLRGQLAQALVRDLASLLSIAREFRNIHRKSKKPLPLKLLHISDLHINSENHEQITDYIQNLDLGSGPFDFLIITGDVIQGRYAAGDLEKHYDYAAQVIRALAFRMWGETLNGETVLRQDWKRRTIIIPGNHDYASMNELETQHGESHRASGGGRPATQEGSAMAKFTYYINFVRKLLDVEIGDLIDNSLNELRHYDKMGVTFLCCNTSIMANPARNNKVHLDENFINRAIRQLSSEKEKQTVIFLGHHGPDYEIDYVSDEYLEHLMCKEITQDFAKAIQKGNDKERKKALEALQKKMEALKAPDGILNNDFIQAWLVRNQIDELPADIKDKVVSRRKKTRLFRQLTFLLEQLEKAEIDRNINERYQKILAEVTRARLLADHDQAAYRSAFSHLETKLKPFVCLSGHTHAWSLRPDKQHFVAKRFFSETMIRPDRTSRKLTKICHLNYGICNIFERKSDQQIMVRYKNVEVPYEI